MCFDDSEELEPMPKRPKVMEKNILTSEVGMIWFECSEEDSTESEDESSEEESEDESSEEESEDDSCERESEKESEKSDNDGREQGSVHRGRGSAQRGRGGQRSARRGRGGRRSARRGCDRQGTTYRAQRRRARKSSQDTLPTGVKDISIIDVSFSPPAKEFFPLRELGPHLPENTQNTPLELFQLMI